MIVGALVRCHCRSLTLEIVLDELLRYQDLPGWTVKIHALVDRGTPAVWKLITKYAPRLFRVVECPFPILSKERGQLFCESLNLQVQDFQDTPVDWLYLADDDRWFEPHHALAELDRALNDPAVDMWYANSLFMWDQTNRYNPERHHWSPVLWRFRRSDRFPTNRIIQATEQVHDEAIVTGRTGTLRVPLLDYGSFNTVDRVRLYNEFVGAGKVDPYIDALLAPGAAGSCIFPDDAVKAGLTPGPEWRDLFTERLQSHGS